MAKCYGIHYYYPRIKKYFGKLTVYFALVRPFTLLAPLIAGIIGVLVPLKAITFSNIETAIYIGITLALAQATGQILNQYSDSELDKTLPEKKNRPIPSGLISREEALGLSWLTAMFAIGRAFTISVFFGLMVLVLLFFSVFYSLTPFSPRKVDPLVNTAWMAISRGFIPMFMVWSIYGDMWNGLKYAFLALAWVFGFQATKDISDVDGDRLYHIKTIPNTFGTKGLTFNMVIFSAVYTVLAIYFNFYLMLLILPLAGVAIVGLRKKVGGLENNLSWIAFYVGLAFIYVLMFFSVRVLGQTF